MAASWPAGSLLAMEHLSDDALASVAGRDGISISVSSPEISAGSVSWQTDVGSAFESQLQMRDISVQSVGLNGADLGVGNAVVDIDLDAGSNGTTAGLRMDMVWQRARTRIEEVRIGSSTASMGTQVIDSSGRFLLQNNNGFFNSQDDSASLMLQIDDADIYYRQGGDGSPEMLMRDFNFLWDMPQGIVGIDDEGIIVEGDVNFNLTFDLYYDNNPGGSPFTFGATDGSGLLFGWTGGLEDAQVRVKPGGLWPSTATTGSGTGERYDRSQANQGLNVSMRWDYAPTFRWVVGEAAGPRTRLEFGQWTKLPGPGYGFDLPFLALDMVNANQGPGGLCWGANIDGPASACQAPAFGNALFVDLPPTEQALALAIRDFSLRAYSTNVALFEPLSPQNNEVFSWTLVATVGNLDGNIFLYPGSSTPGQPGIRSDFVITAQTFDVDDFDGDGNTFEQGPNWEYGTHFMIADSDTALGIGLVNASMLVAGKDVELSLTSEGINLNSNQVRLAINSSIAGGDLPNMNEMVFLSDAKLNLEFDLFDLTIIPSQAPDTYLGFEGDFRLANTNIAGFSESTLGNSNDDGSYFSLAEPNRPTQDIRLADITGSLSVRNGRVDLMSTDETPAGRSARLSIENDLLIGVSAPDAGGQVLEVRRIEFNNQNLARFVVPGGQWHARMWLEKQVPGL